MNEGIRIVIATGEGGVESRVSAFEDSPAFTVLKARNSQEFKEDKIVRPEYPPQVPPGELSMKKALLIVKELPDVVIAESYSSNVLIIFNMAEIETRFCQHKTGREAVEKYFTGELSSPVKKAETKKLVEKEGPLKITESTSKETISLMGLLRECIDNNQQNKEYLQNLIHYLVKNKRNHPSGKTNNQSSNLIKHRKGFVRRIWERIW